MAALNPIEERCNAMIARLALVALLTASGPGDGRAAESLFFLPFPAGVAYAVLQGNRGLPSHQNDEAYAWDFAMPRGSLVVASAPGIVVEVEDGLGDNGADAARVGAENRVVVDVGAARFAVYAHLQRGSAKVREGDVVAGGQELGRVGQSGAPSEPHLHFAVVNHHGRTAPIRFADVAEGVPRAGMTYRSQNVAGRPVAGAVAATPTLSLLPRDAFVDNGVELLVDLPAHLWRAGGTLVVTGRAITPSLKVVAFIMDRTGGPALVEAAADPAADGRFTLTMPLSPRLRGRRAFAMALAAPNGSFGSLFSVPIVVR